MNIYENMYPNSSETFIDISKLTEISKENENLKNDVDGLLLSKTCSETKQLEVIKEEKSDRSLFFQERIDTITANSPILSDSNAESNCVKTLCFSKYSKLNESSSVKANKLNNIGKFNTPIWLDKNQIKQTCKSSEYAKSPKDRLELGYTVHLNKSFYLIRNMRLEQKIQKTKRVSLDSLGGRSCCKKLKDNYEIEILKSEEILSEREGRAERSVRSAKRAFSQDIKINVRDRQRKYSQSVKD